MEILAPIHTVVSTTLKGAISNLNSAGLTEDDALKFQVEMIRRFKPQVVVGHDENGEYSHGQHILNTYLLKQAILKANDSSFDEVSFNKYGNWQISKLYLHLYEESPIVMDYDIPLEYFGGRTAYEVSKEGYSKHLSQQWTWFTGWINGKNNNYTKATDIKTYSPLKYGLYYSNVGEDIQKNDMLENIKYYKIQFEEEEQRLIEEAEKETIITSSDITNQNDNENELKSILIVVLPILMLFIILIIIKNIRRRK